MHDCIYKVFIYVKVLMMEVFDQQVKEEKTTQMNLVS